MRVKSEHVAEGIALFAETELLPAFDGWRLWAASAAFALLHKQSSTLIAKLKDNKIVSALGIFDDDGSVDIGVALEALKEALRKHGKMPIEIPLLDMEFSIAEKDVESLRGYIRHAAGIKAEGE